MVPKWEPLPGIQNVNEPRQFTSSKQAEVASMDTEGQDAAICLLAHSILQSFLFRCVGDFPMALAVLLPGDVEEQWWPTGQECKDKPPGVMPGVIKKVDLKELALSNHVLQRADDAHEKQVPVLGAQICQLVHFLRPKKVEHVCRRVLWLLVLPPGVPKLLARMPKDTLMQSFSVHVAAKLFRTTTEIVFTTTSFHSTT